MSSTTDMEGGGPAGRKAPKRSANRSAGEEAETHYHKLEDEAEVRPATSGILQSLRSVGLARRGHRLACEESRYFASYLCFAESRARSAAHPTRQPYGLHAWACIAMAFAQHLAKPLNRWNNSPARFFDEHSVYASVHTSISNDTDEAKEPQNTVLRRGR